MVYRFPLTLNQLSYFVECANTLNMTAASQELHVAQSAVSTAITQLERSLGTNLFIRQHSKGLILTPAGERLLRDTEHLFGLLGDSIETIRTEQEMVRGTIKIACFNTLAPFLLPELIRRVEAQYPELTVETFEGNYDEILTMLRSGRAEIALTYALTELDDVNRTLIGESHPYVLLHTDHPLAGQSEVSLTDLADEDFVLLDLPSSREYFLGILRQYGITPKIRHKTTSYETVRSMVASGLGFSILNQRPFITGTYTGPAVSTASITEDAPALELAISSLGQTEPSGRARAVTEIARQMLAEEHPLDQ